MTRKTSTLVVQPLIWGALSLTLAAVLAAPASSTSGIRNAWRTNYPNSQSYQNASCSLCHLSNSTTNRYNSYGYAIKQQIDMGASNVAAFSTVEGLDSDGDPTGSTNLFEITNDVQPGWTPGANNTTYTGGGNPTTGVTPPMSITGLLDPTVGLGTNYCTAVPNSTGTSSVMSASGSSVAADNDVTLTATQMPTAAFGFFLVSQVQGFAMNPGGSAGNLCLGGSIGRYVGPGQIQNSGMLGEISLALDLTAVPQPTGAVAVAPGETWNFQAWYRDAVGGTAVSNFSDGLSILFQ